MSWAEVQLRRQKIELQAMQTMWGLLRTLAEQKDYARFWERYAEHREELQRRNGFASDEWKLLTKVMRETAAALAKPPVVMESADHAVMIETN